MSGCYYGKSLDILQKIKLKLLQIIGYVGERKCINILLDGLKALEYRGYDSSGIAYNQNNEIKIIKSTGKVQELENKIDKNLPSYIGIGHTRWATHGIPNEINAHPHHQGKTTLVHNGIIENYIELKKELSSYYNFKSETDTEVAAALIDYLAKNNSKLEALKKAMTKIIGSYALAIIFDDEPETIYAIRKDSPMIIAQKNNDSFVASDIAAILKYTNEYYILNEGEIAKLTKEKLTIFNNNLQEIKKDLKIYQGNINDIMKNGFDHFMLKEIFDETSVYQNIINTYFPNCDIKELVNNFPNLSKYEKIKIIGCGSAYHAGMVAKSILEDFANIETTVEMASEYRYKKIFPNSKELVILISQSGETADTLEALRIAKKNNIDTLAIVNVNSSSIARESDMVIYCLAGCEIAVATTKAYLAQVLILSLITLTISYNKKIITNEEANNYLFNIKNLISDTKKILDNKEEYQKLASKIYKNNCMFFIGREIDYAICMEASLKMKEISYIHSEAYPAGELKHGTISLIEQNTPVIGIITQEEIAQKTISNLKETKARGSKIIIITTQNIYDKYLNDHFYEEIIIIKDINILLQSLVTVTPLQLLSYYVAKLRGEDIDKPRNLAKSVTVE